MLNLSAFFGETPANPELCELILRATSNLMNSHRRNLTENESFALGVLAYIYSYSAVEMGKVLHGFTSRGNITLSAGRWNRLQILNSDTHVPNYIGPTVNCAAALNLTDEPVLLYTPDIDTRYFSYQFIDAHANTFAYLGTRATHGRKGIYAVVGPGWRGKLSSGLNWIQSLTAHNLMIGRIYVRNPNETLTAREIYRQSTLAPVSCFRPDRGNDLEAVSLSDTVSTDPDGLKWFEFANRVLNDNPPPASENDLISLFAWLGFGPGFDLNINSLSSNVRSGLERSIEVARNEIVKCTQTIGSRVNGWHIMPLNRGILETNYLERSAIALERLTEGSTEEMHYAECRRDVHGRLLSGGNEYLLRFERGQAPPVKAFWSITSYDASGATPHRRSCGYRSVCSGTPGLLYGDDGSLILLIQHSDPGKDAGMTWLPVPKGKFTLMLRMFLPTDEAMDDPYQPPAVRKILPSLV